MENDRRDKRAARERYENSKHSILSLFHFRENKDNILRVSQNDFINAKIKLSLKIVNLVSRLIFHSTSLEKCSIE